MISGQVPPLVTSLTKATTTGNGQLSDSSVTTAGLGAGTSPIHCALIGAGFDAVGLISSLTVISCVTVIKLLHASVTLYVRVTMVGHVPAANSLTKATTGTEQLSASSVTTFGSGAGTSPIHWKLIPAGF